VIERFERACVLWCCLTISTWSKELQSNFCFKFGKNASETYELLQKAFGSDSLSCSMTFEWFKLFREGRELLEDDDGEITCENNVRLLRRSRCDSL
jgi:hypothetical protein